MTWKVGDRGQTSKGYRYRIVADDLAGGVGPIAAAVILHEDEQIVRYPATGVHPGGLAYYDLQPPKVPA